MSPLLLEMRKLFGSEVEQNQLSVLAREQQTPLWSVLFAEELIVLLPNSLWDVLI